MKETDELKAYENSQEHSIQHRTKYFRELEYLFLRLQIQQTEKRIFFVETKLTILEGQVEKVFYKLCIIHQELKKETWRTDQDM